MRVLNMFFCVLFIVLTQVKLSAQKYYDILNNNIKASTTYNYESSKNSYEIIQIDSNQNANKRNKRLFIGSSIGINYNTLSSNHLKYDSSLFVKKSSINPSVGLISEYFINKNSSLVLGVNYFTSRPKLRLVPEPSMVIADLRPNYNILQFPLSFKYRLTNKNKLHLTSFLGLSINRTTLSSLSVKLHQFEGNYEGEIIPNIELTNWESKLNYSIIYGIGIENFIRKGKYIWNFDIYTEYFPIQFPVAVYDYTVSGTINKQAQVAIQPNNFNVGLKSSFLISP